MQGAAGGTRDPAGLGPAAFEFSAAAACPWGCVLGPGGWNGAPFCPRHCLPEAESGRRQVLVLPQANRSAMGDVSVARDDFGRGPGFWYCPSQLEGSSEGEEEVEEWVSFGHSWDISSEDSDIPYSFCEFQKPLLYEGPLPTHRPPSELEVKLRRLPAPWGHQPTAEEAERNAQELVAEEERIKKKAEKKKLKKKKQKDRKKREKMGQELKSKQEMESTTATPSTAAGTRHPQNSSAEAGEGWPGPHPSPCLGDGTASEGEEGEGLATKAEEVEDELDLSCTFVVKARQKAGVRLPAPRKEKPPRTDNVEPGKKAPGKAPEPPLPCLPTPRAPDPKPLDPCMVEQSLILADHGNKAAQQGLYAEAVQAFTEAVALNPREHRLFGNRSYCYEKLRRYEEALRDALVSLRLQPGWPKGFFRKGKALRGLQRYAEAASTFEELLCLDGADAEAATQLEACRALLQVSQSGPGGVPVSPVPLEAEEPVLPPYGAQASRSCPDTDTSGFVTVRNSRSQGRGPAQPSSQQTLPLTHPARDCYPLWVGNVTPKISKKVLHSSFSRFGEIRFIRLLPERRCAFINYTHKAAAEAAYVAMQDTEMEGSRLVLQLKHPSHATPAPRWHGGAHPGGLP
ncbi:tetratricopeptide repeat protein 31 [Porphyrio hochstetteri]